MFRRCASQVARAASADQIAFGPYLPGAEMMLAASLHSIHEDERQMLFQHLGRLSRGRRPVNGSRLSIGLLLAVLNARGIGFCMRVAKAGNTGFVFVCDFLRSGENERIVTLAAPDRLQRSNLHTPQLSAKHRENEGLLPARVARRFGRTSAPEPGNDH